MSSVEPDKSSGQGADSNWYPPPPPPVMETGMNPTPGYALLPSGVVLTSPGRRLGQFLLDILLFVFTLAIGWIIWSLVVWGRGQTPAMQLLHIQVIKSKTAIPATWGTMFVREFLGKHLLMGLIAGVFFPAWIVLVFMILWDKNRQEPWDKIADTLVVDN